MRKGDLGAAVANLQRRLNTDGARLDINAVFDEATEAALIAWQRTHGLVADGIAGPKTIAVLTGQDNGKLLQERDLIAAAARLCVELAAIKAVNAVESRGHGFLDDGRPVILYERHVAYRLADEDDLHPEIFWQKTPNILNPKRGGYAGGSAEWSRLAQAAQILPLSIVHAACSWGQFQVMGYHWEALGYESIDAFVAAMNRNEAAHLDAFVRFIEADADLHKALKARKWPAFARLYNGPAYKENLYDAKLARAYERFASHTEAAA